MTAIILAGGKATRLGGMDKGRLKIGKQTLILRQLRLLKKIFKKIIVVTNSPQKYRHLKKIEVITDIIPYQGPLGGIYSGLLASQSKYNFVLACDMPLINLDLIKYMCKNSRGYDVVVPAVNHQYEPLFSIYAKSCLKYIKQQLDKKNFKIREFFPKIKIRKITEEEISRFGSPKTLFMNINTPQDLKFITYGK